jgi:Probable zinc-ribbon domain
VFERFLSVFRFFAKPDIGGEHDPRQMLPGFPMGAMELDYDSAIKADVTRQVYTVVPRYWYVDATLRCEQCGDCFRFSAHEQKAWYEDYSFYVDSFPKLCKACRRDRRDLKSLRQEYDRDITGALASDDCAWKLRIANVIDRLCELDEHLPIKVRENRKLLAKHIARHKRKGGT